MNKTRLFSNLNYLNSKIRNFNFKQGPADKSSGAPSLYIDASLEKLVKQLISSNGKGFSSCRLFEYVLDEWAKYLSSDKDAYDTLKSICMDFGSK